MAQPIRPIINEYNVNITLKNSLQDLDPGFKTTNIVECKNENARCWGKCWFNCVCSCYLVCLIWTMRWPHKDTISIGWQNSSFRVDDAGTRMHPNVRKSVSPFVVLLFFAFRKIEEEIGSATREGWMQFPGLEGDRNRIRKPDVDSSSSRSTFKSETTSSTMTTTTLATTTSTFTSETTSLTTSTFNLKRRLRRWRRHLQQRRQRQRLQRAIPGDVLLSIYHIKTFQTSNIFRQTVIYSIDPLALR